MSNPRPTTRSQSEGVPNLLAPPLASFRRRRSPTRDERLRSPYNVEEENEPIFRFDMATPEQLAALRDELRAEIRNELRVETVASAARDPDAIKRKPEIPPFDKEHVDYWIKRTENAFIRALITSPREKFAFLETKFPVNFNPRINDFLFGEATDDTWTDFLQYLRDEYGPTKQQQASVLVDGFKRDGRRPSQYAAALNEKTKDVTLDDVKKEMLVREMPVEIRRMLQERIEGLSFVDAAKTADAYFDKEGRPRHNTAPSVSAVHKQEGTYTVAFEEDTEGVNAIGKRFQKPRSGGNRNVSQHASSETPQQRAGWNSHKAKFSKPKNLETKTICSYHANYGDQARKCEVGCYRFDENRFPGNEKAGRK